MTELFISDNENCVKNLLYLQKNLSEVLRQTGSSVNLSTFSKRATLTVSVPKLYRELIIAELSDKIAEVIAVGYKYAFLKKCVKTEGLSTENTDLLFAGIISADLDGDKRYILSKLKGFEDMAIDGIYNFRLKLLKEKWQEVASLLPVYFTTEQLHDFLAYICKGKKSKVYMDENSVYDEHYRKLLKAELITDNPTFILETVLSGAEEIRLLSDLSEKQLTPLKEFYGGKITFSQKTK